MFTGQAKAALDQYTALFEPAEIVLLETFEEGEAGPVGTIKQAIIDLKGQQIRLFDNYNPQDFDFTPAMSFFVNCDTEAELDKLFAGLSDAGKVLMPPGNYGFSQKFAWAEDRFGVNWQLNVGEVNM